jgi:hypothetical protein
MKVMIIAISTLLTLPALAAAKPVYHDCRLSEDIINGRAVHKTVCQNQDGDWVEVRPEKKAPAAPAALKTNPVKKPVYRNCRPFEEVVNGHAVEKTICQNETGAWVAMHP